VHHDEFEFGADDDFVFEVGVEIADLVVNAEIDEDDQVAVYVDAFR